MNGYIEKPIRSIVKVISWRLTATTVTMIGSYLFIGDLTVALSIGFFESIAKIIINYIHERVWTKLKFGLEVPKSDYSI